MSNLRRFPVLRRLALAPAASCALAGCDASAVPAIVESGARRPDARPVDFATAGSIDVRVRFAGSPPPPERVAMSGDASCCKSGREQLVRTVDVGPDGGLANAFVWVREGLADYDFGAAPAEPVVLDQRGCAFVPRVLGVRVGQPLRILNGDDTLHDVHAIANANRSFNFGFPEIGSERSVAFRRPEVMVELRCHVHDWMTAWLGVVGHPCFATTGTSGAAALRPVPPGDVEVAVWHEKLGTQSRRVTVAPSSASAVEFVFEGK